MTFTGPPFDKRASSPRTFRRTRNDLKPIVTFPPEGHTCTITVAGKAWDPTVTGSGRIEDGGVFKVQVSGSPNNGYITFSFTGKRTTP